MSKRLLLILPLALALSACGSSGNHGASNAPATTASAATTQATAATTTPAATSAPAEADSAAAPAASTAPAAGTSAAPVDASTSTGSPGMDAAAKAARAKAAKDFVDNGKWVEGKNYFLIQPQQPKVTNTDKVEVVEVFNYGCPACNAAHKIMDKLKASLPPYATMAYLPAGFRPDENWVLYQRAYLTAKALGVADKTYDAMFDATWKTGETGSYNLATGRLNPRSKWATLDDIAKFYGKHGISPKQFKAVANSFTVNTKIKRADKLVKDYGVAGTPTVVIDGKYRFTPNSAGGYSQMIEMAKWLVAREAAGE